MPIPARTKEEKPGYPPALAPLNLLSIALPSKTSRPQPSQAQPSQIRFTGGLAKRAANKPVQIPSVANNSTPLTPCCFLIGVDDRGETRHLFLQNSSGSKSVDRAVEESLARSVFAPDAGTGICWDFVTIYWGNETASGQP